MKKWHAPKSPTTANGYAKQMMLLMRHPAVKAVSNHRVRREQSRLMAFGLVK